MKKLLYAACIAAVFCSCKKDTGDTSFPVIALSTPSDHQNFKAGQTVTISASISDNDELHEVHLYVKNKATSAEILHVEEHTDTKTYTLLKTFTAQAGVTYKIELEANDHSDNESKVEIEVNGVN